MMYMKHYPTSQSGAVVAVIVW